MTKPQTRMARETLLPYGYDLEVPLYATNEKKYFSSSINITDSAFYTQWANAETKLFLFYPFTMYKILFLMG